MKCDVSYIQGLLDDMLIEIGTLILEKKTCVANLYILVWNLLYPLLIHATKKNEIIIRQELMTQHGWK